MAPKGPDEGAIIGRFFVGPDALIGPLGGSFRRGVSPPAGGDPLCPWRLVVAMAQATFSWPFGPIHLESACLRFRLTAKTAPAPLFLLFPANPLRWASPGVTTDWEKRHRGRIRWATAPARPIGCFPRTPLRGMRTCEGVQNFRRAKSEWFFTITSGPLGPGCSKIAAGAIPRLRLAWPSR